MKSTFCLVLAILLASTIVLGAPSNEQYGNHQHGNHHHQHGHSGGLTSFEPVSDSPTQDKIINVSGSGSTSFEPVNPHGQGGTSFNPSHSTGGTSFEPVDPNHQQHTSYAQKGK